METEKNESYRRRFRSCCAVDIVLEADFRTTIECSTGGVTVLVLFYKLHQDIEVEQSSQTYIGLPILWENK